MITGLIKETSTQEIPPHVTTTCRTCVDGLVNVVTEIDLVEEREFVNSTLLLCSPTGIPTWIKAFNLFGVSHVVYDDWLIRRDVVICTPSSFNKAVGGYHWKRFIFDDPHLNKVSYMRDVNANFHWLVTSQPFDTEGLWSNSRYVGEYMAKILRLIHEPRIVDCLSFSSPEGSVPAIRTINKVYKGYSKTFSTFESFITHDRMNELLTSCDINGIIARYGGGKTNDLTSVIDAQYQQEIAELRERNNPELLASKLRRYEELRITIREYQRYVCPICHEELRVENTVMEPSCNALFCVACLTESLRTRRTCPVCRGTIDRTRLTYVSNDTTPVESLPTKDDLVMTILGNELARRVVIYSSGGLQSLKSVLQKANVPFRELRGALSTIQKALASNVKVFIAETIHSGFFIPDVTDLILYNSMRKEKVYKTVLGMCRTPFCETEPLRVHQLLFEKEDPGVVRTNDVPSRVL